MDPHQRRDVAAVLGYTSGLDGHRPVFAATAMFVLSVAVVYIIMDLDRPKRGLIQVDQQSLHDVAALVHHES